MQTVEVLCQKHGLSFEQYGQEIDAFARVARMYGGLPIAQAAEAVLHTELSHNFFQTLLDGGSTCYAVLAELANNEHANVKRGKARVSKSLPRGEVVQEDGVYNALFVASTSWNIFMNLFEGGEDVEGILRNFPRVIEEQVTYIAMLNAQYQIELPYGI